MITLQSISKKDKFPGISGYSSILLDVMRLVAALTVVYVHARDQWIPSESHTPGNNTGCDAAHNGVIVFFVLSGYVIAYTTANNNRGPKQYITARLSRLYSILLPALIISAFAQLIVSKMNPILNLEYSRGQSLPRYVLSSLFLNEVGSFSAAPPINRPLWSLSYEFWYYTIFGFVIFRRNGWKSYIPVLITILIAGPKIILMMPIWLMGVFAYKFHCPTKRIREQWFIVAFFLGLTVLAIIYLKPFPYALGIPPFFYSNQFITDFFVGLIFGLALWSMPSEKSNNSISKPTMIIRRIADLTFPIYVLHHPLLILWRAIFGYQLNNHTQMWQAIFVCIAVSTGIGILLEKQRYHWTNLFTRLVNGFSDKSKKYWITKKA